MRQRAGEAVVDGKTFDDKLPHSRVSTGTIARECECFVKNQARIYTHRLGERTRPSALKSCCFGGCSPGHAGVNGGHAPVSLQEPECAAEAERGCGVCKFFHCKRGSAAPRYLLWGAVSRFGEPVCSA